MKCAKTYDKIVSLTYVFLGIACQIKLYPVFVYVPYKPKAHFVFNSFYQAFVVFVLSSVLFNFDSHERKFFVRAYVYS